MNFDDGSGSEGMDEDDEGSGNEDGSESEEEDVGDHAHQVGHSGNTKDKMNGVSFLGSAYFDSPFEDFANSPAWDLSALEAEQGVLANTDSECYLLLDIPWCPAGCDGSYPSYLC